MEKLVRDNIIQKILDNGENPEYRIASQQEKISFLLAKLLEEATELSLDQNQEELADVEEVILALYQVFWWKKEEVEKIRLQKLQKNWGFEKWHILKIPQK